MSDFVIDDLTRALGELTGQERTLTIQRSYVEFFDSIDVALFWCQCLYWNRITGGDWFYKTYAQWYEELYLTEYQVRKAAKACSDWLTTKVVKAHGSPTVHYQVDGDAFSVSILKFFRERTLNYSSNVTEETSDSFLTQITPETTPENASPLDDSTWPDYYRDLYSLKGFKKPLKECEEWLAEKRISVAHANQTAASLRSQWPGVGVGGRAKWSDVWATFRGWVQRPPLGNPAPNRPTRAPANRSTADLKSAWGDDGKSR